MKKLDNERFVKNAPADVLELERKKKSDAESKIKSLQESLKSLKKIITPFQFFTPKSLEGDLKILQCILAPFGGMGGKKLGKAMNPRGTFKAVIAF